MIAVIFEVEPQDDRQAAYLHLAAEMLPLAESIDGFISIERFASLTNPSRILSLSFWRDEQALSGWRNLAAHRSAQSTGRRAIFKNYRLRVASVLRDYGLHERDQAPADSQTFHKESLDEA